jgi:hypothetical protein
MHAESDWHYPEPRPGLAGHWDRFIGPGATASEQLIALLPALLGALAVIAYALSCDLGWSYLQYTVAAALAFDTVGGVATNATSSAKRWYHRPGQTVPRHLGFTALHLLHLILVAWLFRDLDLVYAAVVFGYLMLAALLVATVPRRIQRSTALLLVCGAILLSEYGFSPTPGLEWFIPVFFIKLLVSHLTVEEPYL